MVPRILDEWWKTHHELGGSVYTVEADWDLIHSPEEYVTELYEQFRQLDIIDTIRFRVKHVSPTIVWKIEKYLKTLVKYIG